MSWFNRLKNGLSTTSNKLTGGIHKLIKAKKIDASTLEEFEEVLLQADLGSVAFEISAKLAKCKFISADPSAEIQQEISKILSDKLRGLEGPIELKNAPTILLMCGVNGNGKTTTAGKLALKYRSEGKSVLLAACDTFRAAAIEQLKIWAQRAECDFITGEPNSDPASVAYKAVQKAKAESIDVVIIDTAGRLHNKQNLMDELTKINTVINKLDENAPHYSILVLDATTGQNALAQAEIFSKHVNLSGMIITKLDGTAKAGVLVSIADKFKLPIYSIGVGEKAEDLNRFSSQEFINALFVK